MVHTSDSARSLTADWIGRGLYWIEDKPNGEAKIMKYDLNRSPADAKKILARSARLWQIELDPYQR